MRVKNEILIKRRGRSYIRSLRGSLCYREDEVVLQFVDGETLKE